MKPTREDRKQRRRPANGTAVIQGVATGSEWRTHALILAALAGAIFLVYSNCFNSGFVVDNRVLLMDPRIRVVSTENLRLIFTKDYWYSIAGSGLYRPLSSISYLFNYAILGNANQPGGYHFLNLILHAANAGMVYALGLLLFGRRDRAIALAAVWGLHPLLTESVTNIIGRSDLLSALGVLGGLLCHIMAAGATGRRRLLWLAGVAMAATVAVFSKESGVVLAAAMALYDLTFREAASWRTRLAGYAATVPALATFFVLRHHALDRLALMHIGFGDNPLADASFWTARMTAIKVIGKYLWLLVWPATLSCDYSYNQVPLFHWPPRVWEDWQCILALLVCGLLAFIAIAGWKRRRLSFFLIAFFFATLSPTSNLLVKVGSIMAERFVYLPSIAFAGALVLAIYRLSGRLSAGEKAAPAILATICLIYAVRTWARNSDWQDDLSLWTSTVHAAPESYKAHMALASAYVGPGGKRIDDAIAEIEKAFAILKDVPDEWNAPAPYIDAGSYYGQKGELVAGRNPDGSFRSTPESTMWYQKSLAVLLHARRIEAANNRADRRRAEARGLSYQENGWYELYLELGAVYLRLGQPRQGLEALDAGKKFKPVPEFFEKMGEAHEALGDPRQATIDMAAALMMDMSDGSVASRLGRLYQASDPGGCAIAPGGQGLNPQCPRVHDDLCAGSAKAADLYQQAGLGAAAAVIRDKAREMRCVP